MQYPKLVSSRVASTPSNTPPENLLTDVVKIPPNGSEIGVAALLECRYFISSTSGRPSLARLPAVIER
jgi:hypothetical protein